jgi:hypothetical protein
VLFQVRGRAHAAGRPQSAPPGSGLARRRAWPTPPRCPALPTHLPLPSSHDALGGRGGSGSEPFDSALEQQALLHGMVPAALPVAGPGSDAGRLPGGGGSGGARLLSWTGGLAASGGPAGASAEMERTALERMRMSINNLSDFQLSGLAGPGAWRLTGVTGDGDAGDADVTGEFVTGDGQFDAADEAEAEVAAYWERQELEAELRRAASAGAEAGVAAAAAGAGVVGGSGGGEAPIAAPESARAAQMLPVDPFDQEGARGARPGPWGPRKWRLAGPRGPLPPSWRCRGALQPSTAQSRRSARRGAPTPTPPLPLSPPPSRRLAPGR